MAMALLAAQRSPDPNTQCGAVIVDEHNHVVGTGYNGLASGMDTTTISWTREGDYFKTKYPWVVHAELNAILNANGSVRGCRMYSTMHPCNECAKAIVQAGIREVAYLKHPYKEEEAFKVAETIFSAAGVIVWQLAAIKKEIVISLGEE